MAFGVHPSSEGASAPSSIAARRRAGRVRGPRALRGRFCALLHCGASGGMPPSVLAILRGRFCALLHCGGQTLDNLLLTGTGSEGASAPSSIAASPPAPTRSRSPRLRGRFCALLHCGTAPPEADETYRHLRGRFCALLHCGMQRSLDKLATQHSEGASAPSSIAALRLLTTSSRSCPPPRALLRPPPLRPRRQPHVVCQIGDSEGASAPSSIAARRARRSTPTPTSPPRALLRPPPLRRLQPGTVTVPQLLRGRFCALLHCGPHEPAPITGRQGGSEGASAPSSIAA